MITINAFLSTRAAAVQGQEAGELINKCANLLGPACDALTGQPKGNYQSPRLVQKKMSEVVQQKAGYESYSQ